MEDQINLAELHQMKLKFDAADEDGDGELSLYEFSCAMYLVERATRGCAPPPSASALPVETFASVRAAIERRRSKPRS